MGRLTEKERIEILIMLGCGDKRRSQTEVCTLFNNKYPDKNITQSAVSKIETKFWEDGNVRDRPRLGRPKVPLDTRLDTLLALQENPHRTSRELALDNGISQRSVVKYLKLEKWHPYKLQLVHELSEDDPDHRIEFCETMMEMCNRDLGLAARIIFSDESTFTLNGEVNRQNLRYWAPQNPHWMREHHTQNPQKVNVWAGIVGDRILGPYFFEGHLTGEIYLNFLRDELLPALAELYPNPTDPDLPHPSLWYQQDGAPPHYARIVRNFLDATFAGHWIGRRGPLEWPARSPDLTPCDYFLWGYLKTRVYTTKPNNVDDLKARIRNEVRRITPQMIRNVRNEFETRLALCQEVGGAQFEHLFRQFI